MPADRGEMHIRVICMLQGGSEQFASARQPMSEPAYQCGTGRVGVMLWM